MWKSSKSSKYKRKCTSCLWSALSHEQKKSTERGGYWNCAELCIVIYSLKVFTIPSTGGENKWERKLLRITTSKMWGCHTDYYSWRWVWCCETFSDMDVTGLRWNECSTFPWHGCDWSQMRWMFHIPLTWMWLVSDEMNVPHSPDMDVTGLRWNECSTFPWHGCDWSKMKWMLHIPLTWMWLSKMKWMFHIPPLNVAVLVRILSVDVLRGKWSSFAKVLCM